MKKMLLFLVFLFPFHIAAQSERTFEAKVSNILDERQIEVQGKKQLYQKLELQLTSSDKKGEKIQLEHGLLPFAEIQHYKVNDAVVITSSLGPDGEEFLITDYVRRDGLRNLFILFVIIAVSIAGFHALRSLVGMILSFFIVYFIIVSNIIRGVDPVLATLLGTIITIPVTFYLSHGINRKTTIAVMATCLTLFLATILSTYAIDVAKLSGFSSEEASFASVFIPNLSTKMKGILLASMIIGLLGILDDITISQASITEELHKTNPQLSFTDLYKKAMNVGKDHIASLVNTLVLVYAGASLPLFLLFYNNPHPFTEIINYPMVADEIVRMLVGSIALILAVPITTSISAFVIGRKQKS